MRRLLILVFVCGLCTAMVGAALAVLPPGGSFSDDDGNIHEPSIEAIAAEGITKGCNPPANTLYCPANRVTRGQMAAFLTRALGLTERADDPFTDDDDSVFEADIERMAAAGITKGCNPPTNDRFCPDASVSRGQMAAFLVRALGYTDAGAGDLFTDDDGSVFEADIDRLGTAGVTKGCNPPENDRYCPDNPVLRDQMASFLTRALNLTPITPPPPTGSTTTTTTVPGAGHPQSGDGWEFIGCSNPTGTCTYSQATTSSSSIHLRYPPLPPDHKNCLRWGLYGCEGGWQYISQWSLTWTNPTGSLVSSFCQGYYDLDTGLIAGQGCSVPIAGKPLGEYHGELCYMPWPSSTCTATLLNVYFKVTN
jgi:hypothetical protein